MYSVILPQWLQLHDEAQGIIGRQGAEGLSREGVGMPAIGNGVPVRGGCHRVRMAVVGEAVAMRVRADGVAGIGDSVSRGVTSFQAVPAGAAFRI